MRCAAWLGACLAVVCGVAAKPARAQRMPVGELEAEARERATLLSQQLPEAVRRRSLPALPSIFIALGAGETALGIAARSPLVTAVGAVTLAGGVAFYCCPSGAITKSWRPRSRRAFVPGPAV